MQDKTKTIEHITQPENYSEKVDAILATPLTVENVDTYADDALNSLIDTIASATKDYGRMPTVTLDEEISAKDKEDIVASYFGINNINNTLDHIISKAHQLDSIDLFIKKIPKADITILPPDSTINASVTYGNGSFEKAATAPKLKSLLFILENEFGVDINDSEQLKITLGSIPDNAMRNEGYFLLELNKLKRTILICDEQGNTTFVLDSNKLTEAGISATDLTGISKDDLKGIIGDDPYIGSAISQTNRFTSKLILALNNPSVKIDSEDNLENPNYLLEEAPEGYLSVSGIAESIDIAYGAVLNAIKDLGITPDGRYRGRRSFHKPIYCYSPQKIAQISSYVEERGYVHIPEGLVSARQISKEIGVDYATVRKAVKELNIESDFGSERSYYGQEKTNLITNFLKEKGVLSEQAPDGYMSITAIADKFEIGTKAVKEAIDFLGIEHDGKYKVRSVITTLYSPKNVMEIHAYLEKKGYLKKVPEGYKTVNGISLAIGTVLPKTVKKIIDRLGIESDGIFPFSTRMTDGYSPEKIELIKSEIAKRKLGNKALK